MKQRGDLATCCTRAYGWHYGKREWVRLSQLFTGKALKRPTRLRVRPR